MKFKRVEIQAFRAYYDVKDGTFDFTTKSNEVADFISIYAPNGFGKSSFYDAVEWGYTRNIGRLLRRDKDDQSSAKAEESNYILKNKDAIKEDKDGFVKLYLTSERKPVERKIPKLRSNQHDYKFTENETLETRKFFQEVIMSQKLIDAFLKEDDAEIRYERFIHSFGDKNLNRKYKIITELIKHNNNKIEGLRQELHQLKALFETKLNFNPEIRSIIDTEIEKLKKSIIKEKSFLEKTVYPKLELERKLLSEFIEKQIESFFNVELINTLYRKIDPNPKHIAISFKCDFSNEKPLLNLFVTGEDKDPPVIPAMYFSSAQLNILSLSIFLAKALNVKDNSGNPVDCIFIDDPLQSMDSINILSTIDLLRSIVVNYGKQIILATHDENFHNLLQKKIPSDMFKAKYIEFETLGKVKQSFSD